MTISENGTCRLADYNPSPWQVFHTELLIRIFEGFTEVCSTLHIKKVQKEYVGPLRLDGSSLQLKSLTLNQKKIAPECFLLNDDSLTILQPDDDRFTLETRCHIDPGKNLSLEGMYESRGTICTQCEAQGFRKITWYLDRPDNMGTFNVRLEADRAKYPALLSNGHCIDSGGLEGGRHYTIWDDPFPKPSYLFAIVAGKLEVLEDSYITHSGRKVRLSFYAEKKDIGKCLFAMGCLKKAMKWDEDIFGLECDLNHYQVVAISDFNMGAMENKGLNIFNSSLVLANPDIALDSTYQDILSVIGHEYFHNWTGNRVTCRDWFQLCLKEGLTVYRDQEFSADMYSRAVTRIRDIRLLRQQQWPEDDGPMSHPPRPDHYQEINNFYTATVYNKGAEVVRLLHTLIGKENFRKGMDLYFKEFDGRAVCQEDFVHAMARASEMDLNQFMLWYTEAGTPVIRVKEEWNSTDRVYSLTLMQETREGAAPDQLKSPRVIPVRLGLLGSSGKELLIETDHGVPGDFKTEATLMMTKKSQTFSFSGLPERPVPSLFRGASAPVKVEPFLTTKKLSFLVAHDSDPFNIWDAGQSIYQNYLLNLAASAEDGQAETEFDQEIVETFGSILKNQSFDPAFKAYALSLPTELMLAGCSQIVDPQAIHSSRSTLTRQLADRHHSALLELYQELSAEKSDLSAKGMGRRSLKNICLFYLSRGLKADPGLALAQYQRASNMTDRIAALSQLCEMLAPEQSKIYLEDFYKRWQHEDQAIDKWFSLQAARPMAAPDQELARLTRHPAFNMDNPNRMRSVFSTFCYQNPVSFHVRDGSGYRLATAAILELDKKNRQMSSLLGKAFGSWRKMVEPCKSLMEESLNFIRSSGKLSPDLSEVVRVLLSQ